jgi:hypothetical protein
VTGKPLIIGFLAVVAVLAAVSVYFSATVDKPDKSVAIVVSPDGKYKAVKVTMAGGGTTPYCFDSIAIILGSYPDDFVELDKAYEIYSGPCGNFANREPSPKIEWLSGTALQITFSTHSTALNAKTARRKNIDVTKSVHVTFVEHE